MTGLRYETIAVEYYDCVRCYSYYRNVAHGKRKKLLPVVNAHNSDVFPIYDDPPGPIADDYIIDPDYSAEA